MRILLTLLVFAFGHFAAFGQDPEAEKLLKGAEKLYNKQKYEEAIVQYTAAIEKDPAYVNAYLRRAFCYSATSQYEKAIDDYSKIIGLKPNHVFALNSRGSAKNKLKRFDEALQDFNRVLEIDPKNQEAYNNRGWAKNGKGDHDGACADWKKSKKLGNQEAKLILKNNDC